MFILNVTKEESNIFTVEWKWKLQDQIKSPDHII